MDHGHKFHFLSCSILNVSRYGKWKYLADNNKWDSRAVTGHLRYTVEFLGGIFRNTYTRSSVKTEFWGSGMGASITFSSTRVILCTRRPGNHCCGAWERGQGWRLRFAIFPWIGNCLIILPHNKVKIILPFKNQTVYLSPLNETGYKTWIKRGKLEVITHF